MAKVLQNGVPQGEVFPFGSSADMTGNEALLVEMDGANGVKVTAGDTSRPVGVITDGRDGSSGEKSAVKALVPGKQYRIKITGTAMNTLGAEVAPEAAGLGKAAASGDTVIGFVTEIGAASSSIRFIATSFYTKA